MKVRRLYHSLPFSSVPTIQTILENTQFFAKNYAKKVEQLIFSTLPTLLQRQILTLILPAGGGAIMVIFIFPWKIIPICSVFYSK